MGKRKEQLVEERERVKRKRAQSKKKTEVAQVPIDEPVKGKQKPVLLELAKNLTSGWQAYWDESSKEVYYGNLVTSKTTWTRPAIVRYSNFLLNLIFCSTVCTHFTTCINEKLRTMHIMCLVPTESDSCFCI